MKMNSAYSSPQVFDLGAIEHIQGLDVWGFYDGGSGIYTSYRPC